MLRYSYFLIFLFCFSCQNVSDTNVDIINNPISSETSDKDLLMPIIEFDYDSYDFGEIQQGEFIDIEYNLMNTGNAPLLIRSAKGSCGCTVPTWRKSDGSATWQPGEDGTIGVKYATNRIGKFTKTITLSTNADKRPVILTIKGEVKAPAKDDGAMPIKKNQGSPLERK